MAKKDLSKELYQKASKSEASFAAEEKKKNAKPKDTEGPDAEMVLKERLERYWAADRGARQQVDWKWMLYDLFVSGNHYAKWDKNTQQIQTAPKDVGHVKVVINKVYTTLRSVRNYTLRNKPKAEVTPLNLKPENVDDAVRLNKFLDALHDKLYLARKLKGSLWHALKYSVGYWQVLWDEDSDYGDEKGEICIYEIDPYDLYWDSNAQDPKSARRATLATRRNVMDIKEDSKYSDGPYKENLSKIVADKQLSSSSVKTRLMQAERGQETSNGKDEGTIIVREFWLKEKVGEETKIRIATMAGDQLIRNELTDLIRLPFFRLSADVEPLSMFGNGWVKNLISPQKLLNRLESQVAEWNDIMNKGKWITDKGAGVRVINNENGQIIEKKRGFDVTQGTIHPLSEAVFKQIDNANRYIEDIGGAHDASSGRIPDGAKSGKAIEALQVGDSNNLSEVVENTEEFLEEVYEYVLYLASQKYQFARNVILVSSAPKREFLKFIGEGAAQRPDGATVIPEKNMVDVKITSWLAHTAEARREVLKELFQMKAIDQQTLLEGYNIGAVADILQRVREEKEKAQAEAMKMESAKANAGQPDGAGQAQAIANIRQIIGGQPLTPPTSGVTQEYVDYIDQFLSSPEGQSLAKDNPQELADIQNLRDQAIQVMRQGAPATVGASGAQ